MNYATLALRSAFRNRLRTVLTGVGVAIAVVSFLFLRTMIAAYYIGLQQAAADRMVTRNKVSFTFPLPLAYAGKIKNVPGVEDLSYMSWFGGIYIDEKNFFAQFAVDAESLLRVYPEILLGPEDKQRFLGDRGGCIVGELLARKYGWKVGDRVPLKGDIYPGDWSFTIDGIYRGRDRSTDVQSMYFHWKYLDERLEESRKSKVGLFMFRVSDPSQSARVAHAVDSLFASSLAETRTESERAFQMSFISMSSAIIKAIQLVSAVMLAILMLILGNTMAMSTRERTREYAVMRAIGFRPLHIVLLVLGEGALVALFGFALAVALAPPVLSGFAEVGQAQFGNFLGNFELSAEAVALAGAAALVGGVVATGLPARRAGQLNLVDALRKVE